MSLVIAGIGPEQSETGGFLKAGFRLAEDQEALFGRDQPDAYTMWFGYPLETSSALPPTRPRISQGQKQMKFRKEAACV